MSGALKNIPVCVALCCWAALLTGQSAYFKRYSVDEGMPFIQVSSIAQSADGTLWLGGYGGVARYDGLIFKHRDFREELIHANVTSIITRKNTAFVGTSLGISVIEDESYKAHLNVASGLADHNVMKLINCGNYVSAIHSRAISVISPVNYNVTKTFNTPDGNKITSATYHENALLIGIGADIYRLTEAGFEKLNPEQSHGPRIFSMTSNGGLLFGSDRGIIKYEHGKMTPLYDRNSALIGKVVTSILNLDKQKVWAATEFGLNKCDDGNCEWIMIDDHPRSNEINCMYRDAEGNVWIGTNYGLYRSIGEAFRHYGRRDGLPNTFVYGIDSDDEGNVWVTAGKGVFKYSRSGFTAYTPSHGLIGDDARDVLCVGNDVYTGTLSGLSVRTGGRFVNYDFRDNPDVSSVHSIKRNEEGEIILCTKNGAGIFENGQYRPIFKVDTVFDIDVWDCVQDDDGRYWFATYEGGLWRQNGGRAGRIEDTYNLKGKQYLALDKDYEGNIWIGTFNGVYLYHRSGDTVTHITSKNGLNSDLIYNFIIDDDSNMWIGTNQGINRLSLPDLYERDLINIVTFGLDEGFTGVECNVNGAHFSDGKLWFGTVNGLMRFEPDKFKPNFKAPHTRITGTRIYYNDTSLTDNCVLPYDRNHITFSFLGVSLTNPQKVQYKFMLEGFDQDWSPPVKADFATYSGLSPGHYTFKVKSANDYGVWNAAPETFSFSIDRPYWKEWWFQSGAGLGIAGILFLIFNERVKRVRIKTRLEQRLDNLKLKALRSQMNPHFIFNSMNSIQYYINRNEKLEANKYLAKFAALMRKMLNNSRKEFVTLREDIDTLKIYLELERMRFEGKFDFEIKMNESHLTGDEKIPPMIIQPFAENAVIHGFSETEENGELSIALALSDHNTLTCTITDNGIGYNRAVEKKKVKRESRLHKPAATGITRERLETLSALYGRKLELTVKDRSELDPNLRGTSVTLKFPLER